MKYSFTKKLRKNQTPAEKILWRKLRDKRFHDYKFRRQVPIGPFIVDFYYPKGKLIIEIDGCIHELKRQYDAERENKLRKHGFSLIRFTNAQVKHHLDYVLSVIQLSCKYTKTGTISG